MRYARVRIPRARPMTTPSLLWSLMLTGLCLALGACERASDTVDQTWAPGGQGDALAAAVTPVGTTAPRRPVPANAPDWVKNGNRSEGDTYYAIGWVAAIKNPALARTTAENRARAKMAEVIGRAVAAGDPVADQSEHRSIGVEIVEHWVSTAGVSYALAKGSAQAKAEVGPETPGVTSNPRYNAIGSAP